MRRKDVLFIMVLVLGMCMCSGLTGRQTMFLSGLPGLSVLLGPDQNHPVGSPGSVDTCIRTFQYSKGGYIVRIDHAVDRGKIGANSHPVYYK